VKNSDLLFLWDRIKEKYQNGNIVYMTKLWKYNYKTLTKMKAAK